MSLKQAQSTLPHTAPSWLDSLRRVIELEREKGFSNRAVMGGMDRFLEKWQGKTAQAMTQVAMLRQLKGLLPPPSGYAGWSTQERERWASSILAFLEKVAALPGAHPAQPPAPPRARTQPPSPLKIGLDSPLTQLPGATPVLREKLAEMGVTILRELLYFFPRRHLDYTRKCHISELAVGEEQTVEAIVWEASIKLLGNRPGTEAILGDETGNIRAVWFNQPYLAKSLRTNLRVVLSGRVGLFKGSKVLESPAWEPAEGEELLHTGRLVPVYPLIQGLHPRPLRRLMRYAVEKYAHLLEEFLPPSVGEACRLVPLPQALRQAHFPESLEVKAEAERRLAFDELFLLQMGVLSRKREWQEDIPGQALLPPPGVVASFLASLPFDLTSAQERALGDILRDMSRPRAMSRLLQGEVGSGKTVLAAAALLAAAASGYQSAIMAPTEVLAEQHFHTLRRLFGDGDASPYHHQASQPIPVTIALLTGGLRPAEKAELQHSIAAGEVHIVVGTHALIQKEVEFARLGLAVVDEQHRFGVLQRAALRQKGYNPHILVMTATPIPRTLALTLYGDLDLSILDQLPPGRQPVKTRWLEPERREVAYQFLHRQAEEGRQAFIICPLIEESEALQTRAAVAEFHRLSQQVFPDLRLGLLHGKMPSPEKEKVMRHFREGEVQVLVATPVVEVGIDVPNATVVLVEGAERFGLSQLHQFRGRVGRGKYPSYCLLLAENPSPEARERLAILAKVHDGFRLAEEDLRLRGPGEFFGTRQSGLPELRMAHLGNLTLLELAREQALALFRDDSRLERAEHRRLAVELARRWQTLGERG